MRLRRRDIRELVFKALFADEFHDAGPAGSSEIERDRVDAGALSQFAYIARDYEMAERDEDQVPDITAAQNMYAGSLINGVLDKKDELSGIIAAYSVGWDIDRLGAAELSVMRICLYEMLYGERLAPAIAINEAMDLIKKYGAPEAAAFVNGILGKKAEELAAETVT